MQKNSYLILGIMENASIAEVHDSYHTLKLKYSQDRFLEGDAGMQATRKLAELEEAYNNCMEDIKSRATIESKGTIYGDISDAIKSNKLDAAQAGLDRIEYRDAEWHYYQSIVYYKKDWVSESKKQLDICVALEPNNDKYRKALEKVKVVMAKENPFEAQGQPNPGMNDSRAGYGQPNPNKQAAGNACCDTCCMMACCDSCCECCGGDLISCC